RDCSSAARSPTRRASGAAAGPCSCGPRAIGCSACRATCGARTCSTWRSRCVEPRSHRGRAGASHSRPLYTSRMTTTVIETRLLRRRFGEKLAVADLSLTVERGEVFGFLGPNGAGKTTSLKMLLGLIEPTSGSGTLLGRPIGDRAARAKVGFLPEHFRFQDWLTGRELLRFHGRLYGLSGPALERRADELL